MAKQIEGVAERILAAAKREFLEKGYVDAPYGPLQRQLIPAPTPFMSASAIRKGCFPPSLNRYSVK